MDIEEKKKKSEDDEQENSSNQNDDDDDEEGLNVSLAAMEEKLKPKVLKDFDDITKLFKKLQKSSMDLISSDKLSLNSSLIDLDLYPVAFSSFKFLILGFSIIFFFFYYFHNPQISSLRDYPSRCKKLFHH